MRYLSSLLRAACISCALYSQAIFALSVGDYQFSIVEVVVPRADETKVQYESPLPLDEIPFKQRNDRFQSIGTAFFVDAKTLASAAHVFSESLYAQTRSLLIRSMDGKVYELSMVTGYDNGTDLVTFTLKTYPSKVTPLIVKSSKEIGTKVCAPGNALGAGISLRCGGEIASLNPEKHEGRWDEIYFSTPVSPGNSGGPLLNERKEVVGVVVRSIRGENFNIATPIAQLAKIRRKANSELRGVVYSHPSINELRVSANDRISFALPLGIDEFFVKLNSGTEGMFEKVQSDYQKKWKTFGYLSKQSHLESLREMESLDQPAWIVQSAAKVKGFTFSSTQATAVSSESDATLNAYTFNKDNHIVGIPYKIEKSLDNTANLMDQVLLIHPMSRQIGSTRTGIKSLGEAIDSFSFKDELGRNWKVMSYPMGFTYDIAGIACTPSVSEILCVPVQTKAGFSLKGQRRLLNIMLSELYFPYRGLAKDWAKFLKMELRPDFVKDASITNERSAIGGIEFQLATLPESEISIDLRLNPKTLAVEPQTVTSINPRTGIRRSIRLYYAPADSSSKEYKRFFSLINDMDRGEMKQLVDYKMPTLVGKVSKLGPNVFAGFVTGAELRELPSLFQSLSVQISTKAEP